MISSFSINRFRAINNCKINGLSQINIFMGRNNSGKSSILEALYLTSAAFDFYDPIYRDKDKIVYLLNRRCERQLNWMRDKDALWHGYETNLPIEIEIKMGERRQLKIELHDWHEHPLIKIPRTKKISRFYQETMRIKTVSEFPYACFIHSHVLSKHQAQAPGKGLFPELLDQITLGVAGAEHFLAHMMFLDTSLIHKMELIEEALWNDLLKKRLDRLVTDVLRKGYEVPVEDLTYVPYANKYQLAVKLPETTGRVDDLGDGARYSMVLLMVAALARDTAILIEEPENHQHPGGLAKSLEMLLDLIKRNNIQLFASTHSTEFLKLIGQIAKEKKIGLLTFFIERDKNGIVEARKVRPEDAENLRRLGLDVRFLDII